MLPQKFTACVEVDSVMLREDNRQHNVELIRHEVASVISRELETRNMLPLTAYHNPVTLTTSFASSVYVMTPNEFKMLVREIENKTRMGIRYSEEVT